MRWLFTIWRVLYQHFCNHWPLLYLPVILYPFEIKSICKQLTPKHPHETASLFDFRPKSHFELMLFSFCCCYYYYLFSQHSDTRQYKITSRWAWRNKSKAITVIRRTAAPHLVVKTNRVDTNIQYFMLKQQTE